MPESPSRFDLPSVDRLLRAPEGAALVEQHGHRRVVDEIRAALDARRAALRARRGADADPAGVLDEVRARLERASTPSLRRVLNLTGTLLHTNLGRALLPEEAIEAARRVAGEASTLEYDLEAGARGERDAHLEQALVALTGAEAATVVNNNAAAVLLVLNTLALKKEVPVSRGELIEIGGSFRLPEIMSRAGCRLREVGTTNRTHLPDYAAAIGPKTALVMKVHTSNYRVQGFAASVPEGELASLCRARGLPFVVDLGSGTLVDLRAWGLPHEPTVRETLAAGADLVCFSGDKLLGGPQAGIVVGRRALVERLRRNPLKRALRMDKMRVAALAAVLALAADPERLRARLPTLRLLTRPLDEVRRAAERLGEALARAPRLEAIAEVSVVEAAAEFGSGALPLERIASFAVAIAPRAKRGRGAALERLARAFRALPVPAIGRIEGDRFLLDCRALEDAALADLLAQLDRLDPGAP